MTNDETKSRPPCNRCKEPSLVLFKSSYGAICVCCRTELVNYDAEIVQ